MDGVPMSEFNRAASAQVFGAVESIRAGHWDDYLHQIMAAIDGRQRTPEYFEWSPGTPQEWAWKRLWRRKWRDPFGRLVPVPAMDGD